MYPSAREGQRCLEGIGTLGCGIAELGRGADVSVAGLEMPAKFVDDYGCTSCGRRGIAPLAILGRAF